MQSQFENNRNAYIAELKSTGRDGWEGVVRYLDSNHFFDKSHCSGHDRYPGGTANHSLWVLKFARETRKAILKRKPMSIIPDDSLVFVCLLHDICDIQPRRGTHGRWSREIMEKHLKCIQFSEAELQAVETHMHHIPSGSVLQNILHNSDGRAIEYTDGIPFGEEPCSVIHQILPEGENRVSIHFDPIEHRYWWDESDGWINWDNVKQLSGLHKTLVEVKAHLYIRRWPLEADFSILKDNHGHIGLFVTRSFSGMGTPTLKSSDKAGFGYKGFIIYVSKYPQYKSSYIVGQKSNGKWGVIAARDNFSANDKYPIYITPMTEYIYDDPDSAIDSMRGNTGHLIRVRHGDFFKKIVIDGA